MCQKGLVLKAESINTSALKCCDILLQLNGIKTMPIEFDSACHKLSQHLRQLSGRYGLPLKQSRLRWNKLTTARVPLCFKSVDGDYIVLAKMAEGQVLVQYPEQDFPRVISTKELESLWSNRVIISPQGRFGFNIRWFIPEFARFKGLLSEVLFLSLLLQFLALLMPLFFQVVMDKVLVHNALSTLDVLVMLLLIVGLFEVVMKGLREYLFAHTTTRIDIRLGLKLFTHLLRLPLAYFKARQVGTIVTRVSELESIRSLLTGAALTLVVDVGFTFVFLSVMYYLCAELTLIILAILPLYFVIAYLGATPLRERIERQFYCYAKNHAFLTETIYGSETVKSLAVEPLFQRRWERLSCEVAQTGFATQTMQLGITQGTHLLQRITSVIVIWIGAGMVINLQMSIGQLIAFNMMVSHINQPMAKMVGLWQHFVQTRVALDKLGDVLNLPTEVQANEHNPSRKLRGNVHFSQVYFRYQPDLAWVLKDLSFEIKAGEHIAIVGASGSGKSTLTRLLQRFYVPQSGSIFIDGQPLKDGAAPDLRKQIGVVMQDNYLFNCTVRDNIALRCPGASFEEVVEAAKSAGAHDFILKLAMGYDTLLSESGYSLSGGEKQRIAIARALIGSPVILILDEATTALDDKTQQIVLSNMYRLVKHRTLITIAHRLSSIKHCDRILFLHQGCIAEQGTHQSLIAKRGLYAQLWDMQSHAKEV